MDLYLEQEEPNTTQRSFIERAVGRELDDPHPPEGVTDGDAADAGAGTGAAASG